MENNKLPDTPWHVGFVKKEESDPRRHKSRCVHNSGEKCMYGKLRFYMKPCPGSSHCAYYAENEQQWNEVYLSTRTAEEEEADTYKGAIARITGKNQENKSIPVQTKSKKVEKPHRFAGVESIRLKDIYLPKEYDSWEPDPKELKRVIKYYEENRKMNKPIVVELRNERYYLKDNYIQYYVSKKFEKTWIKSTMNLTSKGCKKKKKKK